MHASSGWGRSIPADRLDMSSSTAGAQRTVSPLTAAAQRAISSSLPAETRRAVPSPKQQANLHKSSTNCDHEYERELVRESIMGVPTFYRGPCFYDPDEDPFRRGEEDPEWVDLRKLSFSPRTVGDEVAAADGAVEAGPKALQHSHGLLLRGSCHFSCGRGRFGGPWLPEDSSKANDNQEGSLGGRHVTRERGWWKRGDVSVGRCGKRSRTAS